MPEGILAVIRVKTLSKMKGYRAKIYAKILSRGDFPATSGGMLIYPCQTGYNGSPVMILLHVSQPIHTHGSWPGPG